MHTLVAIIVTLSLPNRLFELSEPFTLQCFILKFHFVYPQSHCGKGMFHWKESKTEEADKLVYNLLLSVNLPVYYDRQPLQLNLIKLYESPGC